MAEAKAREGLKLKPILSFLGQKSSFQSLSPAPNFMPVIYKLKFPD
jgi:hypothetical protein